MEKYLFILRSCPFFSGMDDREILSILRQLHGEGQTVVMITHDDSIAAAAPAQMRMEAGRLK